jgi:hypothetical protein
MTKAKGPKLASKPAPKMTLGEYLVVATPAARKHIDFKGEQVLDPIRHEPVDQPRELVIDRVDVRGRPTVLIAFLNPYVKTAYVDFLDEERLNAPERTRERAMRVVSLGIGARPDLPPGDEYVDKIWRELVTRE